ILTFFVFCLEGVGGILANSLALISDAAHMLTDVVSLSLAWFALKIAARPSTNDKTYGYHRMEIFAAFINGVLLALMACGILYEAVLRILEPEAVQSKLVIIIALMGLVTNLGVIYFLKHPYTETQDLNVKSAFYHVIGDTLASIGVLLGACVMLVTGWYIVDAILAVVIGGLLIWGAKSIIAEATHILLEGVPKGISVTEVKQELKSIPDIKDIHELHIWSICSNIYALSTHALVSDQKINQAESILSEARERLETKFNITHSTIQFESNPCHQAAELCGIRH
ncbi:MAG: cation diffusion facilitator family transporter, partial [Nitrospinota bacterium]|nr:cation diffusion facilitator family transporter [Nitrospinota bacterium]